MSFTSDSNRTSRLQRTGGLGFAWDVKPSMNQELFEAGLPGDPGALPLDRWLEGPVASPKPWCDGPT